MKTPFLSKVSTALLCLCAVGALAAVKDNDSVVTAVFSRSFNNYMRPANPDGSPKIQTYVVAKGGYAPGLGSDPSIDQVKFEGIVRVLGKYLAKEGYYPAKDPKKADLMLVVHWGKTTPFSDGTVRNFLDNGIANFSTAQVMGLGLGAMPGFASGDSGLPPSAAGFGAEANARQVAAALADEAREQMVQGLYEIRFAQDMRITADQHNANLLGYTQELKDRDNPSLYAGAGTAYYDLMNDVETERYYVALTAYDFQNALKNNHKKGLWRTVTSIDARSNRFDERLVAMVEKASRYFGKDSGHLVRDFEYTPNVSFGELKVLGVVDGDEQPKKK